MNRNTLNRGHEKKKNETEITLKANKFQTVYLFNSPLNIHMWLRNNGAGQKRVGIEKNIYSQDIRSW